MQCALLATQYEQKIGIQQSHQASLQHQTWLQANTWPSPHIWHQQNAAETFMCTSTYTRGYTQKK